jgi:lipopolysaccharide export system protein LptA
MTDLRLSPFLSPARHKPLPTSRTGYRRSMNGCAAALQTTSKFLGSHLSVFRIPVFVALATGTMVSLTPLQKVPTSTSAARDDAAKTPPIDIVAERQDAYSRERRLVFDGNVEAVQGQDRLRTPRLTVYTAKEVAQGQKKAAHGTSLGRVQSMEAEGPVFVTTPTQNARGDHATYIAADDAYTLSGNVVLVQGKNVSTGDRLVVNRGTDTWSLYSGPSARRVHAVIYQDAGPSGAVPSSVLDQK